MAMTSPEQFPARLALLGFQAGIINDVSVIMPPICNVPAGIFQMGSDPSRDAGARDEEFPPHLVTLPSFQIAKYPVTVAEYACFVHTGYKEPWGSSSFSDWKAQLQRPDHPVVNVTGFDAVAYAAWLTRLTGQPWGIPSEAEWEKAARGTDGRIYPWGDTFDPSLCYTREVSRGDETIPVGSYPSGASPYGVQDTAGNVSDWTRSRPKLYPYIANDGREAPDANGRRVVRGGSWLSHSGGARVAARGAFMELDGKSTTLGFRLVLVTRSS
jgi:formylglycine-generating enzyme required for sulfatase activity